MTPISLDFETYSEAGYFFDGQRWRSIGGAQKGGFKAVGAACYAEHPSTEVLIACYGFRGGPVHTWVPGMEPPALLLGHVMLGGLVCAYNSFFEYLIWTHVCRRLYGWADLPLSQTQDTAAAVCAFGLPWKLGDTAAVMQLAQKKDTRGAALIRRFSIPRSPSKNDPRLRRYMGDDPEPAREFYDYCAQDVRTEIAVAEAVPPLLPEEHEVWRIDQDVNERGVAVDREMVAHCQAVVDALSERYTAELRYLTNGGVQSASQRDAIINMFGNYGIHLGDLTAETVAEVLGDESHVVHQHPWAKRVLEIRAALASASVKKLAALQRTTCSDGRVRGLFVYCGAERTGRWAGRGVQPQNMPRGDAEIWKCTVCGRRQGPDPAFGCLCVFCGGQIEKTKWNHDAALDALESFRTRDLDYLLHRWGDQLLSVMGGTLRALFVAAPGYRLLCTDYSAIEAVVLAALAGEEWRLEVFRTHGKIYETSASKITGIPLQEYLDYKERTREHHPHRQKIGKIAELASGYQGGIGAWKNFGADEYMGDEEIKANVRRWREESPAIVNFWYGLERTAIAAIRSPGHTFTHRQIRYHYDGRVLRCILPSGRALCYHQPCVVPGTTPWGASKNQIMFWGWNSNPKYGALGWVRQKTYGGRLTENVVQAVSRDILAHGMRNITRAGYRIVLHIHDEVVCEEPVGRGSVAELEALMGSLPVWAEGWPVVARGGWEDVRYRKEA